MPRVARARGEQPLERDDALEPRGAPLERDLDAAHSSLSDDEERLVAVPNVPGRWLERCLRGRGGDGVTIGPESSAGYACEHQRSLALETNRQEPHARRGGRLRHGALVGAALAAAGACIPDLPPDQAPPAPAPVVDQGHCGDGYIDLAAGEQCDPPVAPDAGSLGCSDHCTVICSGLRWPHNDHCYELMSAAATALQGEASSRCANLPGGGHVVTFASEGELDAVTRYLADAGAGPFWVGLWQAPDKFNSVNAYEPGWSPTCPGCYAHTSDAEGPAAALRGGRRQSDGARLRRGFRRSRRRHPGLSTPAAAPRPFAWSASTSPKASIRRRARPGSASISWPRIPPRRTCTKSSPLSWTDAEARCRGLGGSLVVLQSRDEREQLWLELSRLSIPPARVWIGLSPGPVDAGDAGAVTWIWDDGTSADAPDAYPSPWGVGQPAGPTPAFLSHSTTQPPVDDTLAHHGFDGPHAAVRLPDPRARGRLIARPA